MAFCDIGKVGVLDKLSLALSPQDAVIDTPASPTCSPRPGPGVRALGPQELETQESVAKIGPKYVRQAVYLLSQEAEA